MKTAISARERKESYGISTVTTNECNIDDESHNLNEGIQEMRFHIMTNFLTSNYKETFNK